MNLFYLGLAILLSGLSIGFFLGALIGTKETTVYSQVIYDAEYEKWKSEKDRKKHEGLP